MALEYRNSFPRLSCLAMLLVVSLGTSPTSAQSDAKHVGPPLPVVKSPRLYIIDCGTLIYNRPEAYNLKREDVIDTNMAVTCNLVVHPKGILLYDTGLSDKIVGRPYYENAIDTVSASWGLLKSNTLSGQLTDIGVAPGSITYLALSHGHVDHIGNVNDYAGATWLTPKAEKAAMFSDLVKQQWYFSQYNKLQDSKTVEYEGDYDVFGDGTVILKATPGHTPGHQSLYVKLANTGGVLLSGDMYHYPQERSLNRMPDDEKSTATPATRAKMEQFLRQTNAQLWIGHDMSLYKNQIHAPGWYD